MDLQKQWQRPSWFGGKVTEDSFLADLKRMWVMSPRDAAGMRESLTRALWRNELPKAYLHSARRLLIHHPKLVDLDREWIEGVALFPKSHGYQPVSTGFRKFFKLFAIALLLSFVVIGIIVLLLALAA